MRVMKISSITINSVSNAIIAENATQIVLNNITITDNEEPVEISFEEMNPTVGEGDDTITLRAILNNASTENVSVAFSTSDGSAISTGQNADFVAESNETLNIAKGETSAEISVTINNDDSASPVIALEGNESFDITLSNAENAIFADSASSISTTVTILDDEPAPTLSFEATSNFNPAENIGNLVLNVSLTSQALLDVSFDVAVEDGTATIGEDYSNPTQNNFSIARGASKPTNSITIPITSDRDFEGNETFDLILTNLTGATFGSSATLRQTITIVDDELPVMKMSNRTATVAENIAGGMLDIDVELNGSSSNLVTFDYYISTGTGVGFATAESRFYTSC